MVLISRNKVIVWLHDLFFKITMSICKGTSSLKLPAAINVKGGKYFHFGIETALNGQSPGVFHFNNRDLFEYLEIHKKYPTLLPFPLRRKVYTYTCL